jgi:rhodanese-related sulfurtransferase
MKPRTLGLRLIAIGLLLVLLVGMVPSLSGQQGGHGAVQPTTELVFTQGTRFISAADLYENLNDGDPDNDPSIISLRSAEDYAKGHIPSAVRMDVKTLFTPDNLATIDPDHQVIFVCYTGQSASQATAALNMLGYNAAALLHGMSSWTADPEVFVKRFDPETAVNDFHVELEPNEPAGPFEPPEPLASTALEAAQLAFATGPRFIGAADLYENLNDGDPGNDPSIISLRSAEDYAKGHVPGAVWMDVKTLFTPDNLATIDPDRDVVVVCYTGQSASQATAALNMLGYDATSLLFGMSSWTADPGVYVKRFDPATAVNDFRVELEPNEPAGRFSLPGPLVKAVQATPEPEPTPEAVAPETTVAQNCVACHTNAPMLQILAVEEEVKSEKTAGEG